MADYDMMADGLVPPFCLYDGTVVPADVPRLRQGTTFGEQSGHLGTGGRTPERHLTRTLRHREDGR